MKLSFICGLVSVFLLLGCNKSAPFPVIGASCADCVPSPYVCLSSSDYCTRRCSATDPCPKGSVCVGEGPLELCYATCPTGTCEYGRGCGYILGQASEPYCTAGPTDLKATTD